MWKSRKRLKRELGYAYREFARVEQELKDADERGERQKHILYWLCSIQKTLEEMGLPFEFFIRSEFFVGRSYLLLVCGDEYDVLNEHARNKLSEYIETYHVLKKIEATERKGKKK